MLPYRQITAAERYTMGLLRQRGWTSAAIARILGRHRSTIGREVRRNRTPRDGCYRPQLADWYACGRRSRSRRNQRFSIADWVRIQTLLREDWSPEQVAGRLRLDRELAISTRRSTGMCGRTSRRAARCTATCAAPANSAANATAATTAGAA
jgi:IS30 family transposase